MWLGPVHKFKPTTNWPCVFALRYSGNAKMIAMREAFFFRTLVIPLKLLQCDLRAWSTGWEAGSTLDVSCDNRATGARFIWSGRLGRPLLYPSRSEALYLRYRRFTTLRSHLCKPWTQHRWQRCQVNFPRWKGKETESERRSFCVMFGKTKKTH